VVDRDSILEMEKIFPLYHWIQAGTGSFLG
jgi:hypothetical protein